MRDWIVDIAWWVGAFVVSTAVGYWLHMQGVDLPSLPEWLTGL
jgi:hydrogenase/urease accessory protein HupE